MKSITKVLVCLMVLLASACKKEEVVAPTVNCKVAGIDRGNANKHTYTYNASAKVATMTREFDGSGSGAISKYVYTFSYDNAGLLIKSVWTLDGKANGSEAYTYTGGKISKVNYKDIDNNMGVNNIKYDEAGRITYFSIETGDPNQDVIQYFTYNTNGVQTKRGFKAFDGTIYFETVITPVGMAKSPEQFLPNFGLPYDVLTGSPWATNEGDVGTILESFAPDANGKLASLGKVKISSVKLDSKGFIAESTSIDDAKVSSTARFTLLDCN